MSDSQDAGFGKFVPGFDFLQSLVKGASTANPQMPNLASWIAPTLNAEELDKRISELKTVHFWLDQNSKALGATVQALEVQKMTLATLKGMNVNIGDMAKAFKLKTADSVFASGHQGTEKTAPASKTIAEMAAEAEQAAQKSREAAAQAATPEAPVAPVVPVATPAAAGMVDSMQLWGALTQQFQQIAASAMKDVSANVAKSAVLTPTAVKASATKAAKAPVKVPAKSATKTATKKVAKKVARKTPVRAS